MSEKLSPFLKRSVACPICRKTSDHRMFRVRLFVPKEIEKDQHVVQYRWQAENTQVVHPPYHALYYCPFCYFTDLLEDFREPHRCKNNYFIAKSFGSFKPPADQLIEFLGRHVDYNHVNFHSALTMHYLAIFIQTCIPADVQDMFKLGRLVLRLAWLYREENAGLEIPDGPATCKGQPYHGLKSFDELLTVTRQFWPQAPATEEEATRLACAYLEKAIAADSRFDRPAKYYQGVKLLLSLLDRCGDLEGAYNTVRGIYAEGSSSRAECQRLMADKNTSAHVREQISADLRVINTYMQDAGDLRDEFLEKMVERDSPRVMEVVQANAALPPSEIEKAVAAAGIMPDVFRRIQVRAAAAAAAAKR